jgi:hypothetical protein
MEMDQPLDIAPDDCNTQLEPSARFDLSMGAIVYVMLVIAVILAC